MKTAVGLFILLFSFLSSYSLFANPRADFAIYDPGLAQAEDGVWKEEVLRLKSMLTTHNWTYEVIGFEEINGGELGSDDSKNYKALIMPGGYSDPRLRHLYPAGQKNIERFVESGGGYIGFCAGSFYATQTVKWAEQASGLQASLAPSARFSTTFSAAFNQTYNQNDDYIYYNNYGSPNIFQGTAKGPFEWTPWMVDGVKAKPTGFVSARINTGVEALRLIKAPSTTKFYYFGGPYFELPESADSETYKVWATVQKPADVSDNADADGKPSIIEIAVGKGKAVLFSYHPVILMSEENVPTSLKEEINYQSWNIMNAAFQIVTHSKVTPLRKLLQ